MEREWLQQEFLYLGPAAENITSEFKKKIDYIKRNFPPDVFQDDILSSHEDTTQNAHDNSEDCAQRWAICQLDATTTRTIQNRFLRYFLGTQRHYLKSVSVVQLQMDTYRVTT